MAQAKNRSKLWFAVHGWMALPVWLFLFFVCVTGTLATVDKEVMWLIDPSVRAVNPDNLPVRPLNRIVEDIQRQVPGAHVAMIRWGEPFMALEVSVATPDQPQATAWVNPFTGQVQRVAEGITFSNFIRALHGWLLMPWLDGTPIGWYAVCLMGLPMLGSVVTGLVIYKRFWRAFTRPRLRLGQGGRVAWGDFHRLAAVWGLWFIVVISATGLWFLVRGVLYDLHVPVGVHEVDIPRAEAPVVFAGQALPDVDLDAALAAARAARPGSVPRALIPPEHALGSIGVYSRSAMPLLQEMAWFHPYDGRLLQSRDIGNADAVEIVTAVAGSLHFGNFAGLWVKLVWCGFGLMLSALVLSGTVIWTKRTVLAPRAATAAPCPAAAE